MRRSTFAQLLKDAQKKDPVQMNRALNLVPSNLKSYRTSSPFSPVRILTASSRGRTKTFPSPILPV